MSQPIHMIVVMFDPPGVSDMGTNLPTDSLWDSVGSPCVETTLVGIDLLNLVPWSDLDPDDQLSAVQALAPLRSRLDSIIATALAAVDTSGTSVTKRGLRANDWMSEVSGDARVTSSKSLRLGKTLTQFPVFKSAIHDQEISIDHAHALADAVTPRLLEKLQKHEQKLIKMASSLTVEQWRKDLRAVIDQFDAAQPKDKPKLRESKASFNYDETGRLRIHGEFFGPDALTMFHIINEETRRQLRKAKDEQEAIETPVPDGQVLRGKAFAELLRRGASPTGAKKPVTEAVLVLDPRSELHPIRTLDGDRIDPLTAAVLACGCELSALHLDGEGAPLKYGRKLRFATTAQTRALAIRDGGCVFPGCGAPASWCDAHHIETWTRDQGFTDIDNMALICRDHHTKAHSSAWDFICDENGRMWWKNVLTGESFAAQSAETRHNWKSHNKSVAKHRPRNDDSSEPSRAVQVDLCPDLANESASARQGTSLHQPPMTDEEFSRSWLKFLDST